MLELQDVSVSLGGRVVFAGVDLELTQGSRTAIVGRSGAERVNPPCCGCCAFCNARTPAVFLSTAVGPMRTK